METSTTSSPKGAALALKIMVSGGALVGLWVVAAFSFALARADWQVGELARQYLVAIGLLQDFETLVDFYTHIKGIEYLICLAFLGSFPAFFKYLNRGKEVSIK
jgi:hypothetical protein